jgi:hypothetical protein
MRDDLITTTHKATYQPYRRKPRSKTSIIIRPHSTEDSVDRAVMKRPINNDRGVPAEITDELSVGTDGIAQEGCGTVKRLLRKPFR